MSDMLTQAKKESIAHLILSYRDGNLNFDDTFDKIVDVLKITFNPHEVGIKNKVKTLINNYVFSGSYRGGLEDTIEEINLTLSNKSPALGSAGGSSSGSHYPKYTLNLWNTNVKTDKELYDVVSEVVDTSCIFKASVTVKNEYVVTITENTQTITMFEYRETFGFDYLRPEDIVLGIWKEFYKNYKKPEVAQNLKLDIGCMKIVPR